MTQNNSQTSDAAAAALAAWESATVQNLNPILDEAAASEAWDAILAHRASGDAEALATSLRAIGAPLDGNARARIDQAIASLNALAASAAKE